MVVVPGSEGDFGVMEGHAPIFFDAARRRARNLPRLPGEPERIPVTGGFARGQRAGLTVLAESAES